VVNDLFLFLYFCKNLTAKHNILIIHIQYFYYNFIYIIMYLLCIYYVEIERKKGERSMYCIKADVNSD